MANSDDGTKCACGQHQEIAALRAEVERLRDGYAEAMKDHAREKARADAADQKRFIQTWQSPVYVVWRAALDTAKRALQEIERDDWPTPSNPPLHNRCDGYSECACASERAARALAEIERGEEK